jgi:hypothetical protein
MIETEIGESRPPLNEDAEEDDDDEDDDDDDEVEVRSQNRSRDTSFSISAIKSVPQSISTSRAYSIHNNSYARQLLNQI